MIAAGGHHAKIPVLIVLIATGEAVSTGLSTGAAKPITAEQRAVWAKEGVAIIEANVKKLDIKSVVQALREHIEFTRNVIVPKYGNQLPNH